MLHFFSPYCPPEYQKAYGKAHYESNKARYVQQAAARKAQLQAEVNVLKGGPCADCGVQYPPYVMDFDHRPGEVKVDHVARMVKNNQRKKVFEEIKKCDIVCANCHRERTHQRAGMI